MRHLLFIYCITFSLCSFCQDTTAARKQQPPPMVFAYVEQMPEPGFNVPEYLAQHLESMIPDTIVEQGYRAVVRFIVNEDGSLSDFKMLRSAGPAFDASIVKVLQNMPKWKAGKQNGKAVKVYYSLPFSFKPE